MVAPQLRALVAAMAALSFVTACASSSVPPLPDPPEVKTPPTSSSVPDFSGTSLAAVPGTTALPPLHVRPGGASLFGRVTAGGAPAGGATVRLERLVGDRSASIDVVADGAGNWSADRLIGGRYRVRAFRPPDATMTAGEVIFLGGSERRSLNLSISSLGGGTIVTSNIAPDPPEVGEMANVVVRLSTRAVDRLGVARSVPLAGVSLTLTSEGGRRILTTNPVTTNAAGRAQWQIRCIAVADQRMRVVLPDGSQRDVNVSSCRLPATTTTTAPD